VVAEPSNFSLRNQGGLLRQITQSYKFAETILLAVGDTFFDVPINKMTMSLGLEGLSSNKELDDHWKELVTFCGNDPSSRIRVCQGNVTELHVQCS
jgi:hypothetical protein